MRAAYIAGTVGLILGCLVTGACAPSSEPACGDGLLAAGEACDDGNTIDGDGCDSACNIEPGYSCSGEPSHCVPGCGDGRVGEQEECDDGNGESGDGCSASCTTEDGWSCSGQPSECSPVCGDGKVLAGEDCDDGNTVSGDGCEPDCTFTCQPGEQQSCGSCGTQECQPDHTWGPCQEYCEGRECGPDICGGSCGTCPTNFTCQPDGTCARDGHCPGAPLPPATSFGFNYAPQGHLCKWVGTEFDSVQDVFERDLDVLASLGTRVVRLMLLPYCLGLEMVAGGGPGNWDQAELDAMEAHLPVILDRFAAHGISVVLASGPNAYWWNGPSPGTTWWEHVYGPNGWDDLVSDLVAWTTEMVGAVEQTSACSHVLYYDLENEVDYDVEGMHTLVRALLSDVPIPPGKLGISLLREPQKSDLAADLVATGASLDFLEFHAYPDRGLNSDVPAVASSLRAAFPGTTVLLGEFGSIYCENGQDEDAQQSTVLSLLDGAEAAGLSLALHWMLLDRQPGTSCQGQERVGLGFEADMPRDVFGGLAARQGLIPNGDFEEGAVGWFVGGTTGQVELHDMGPDESDAATNAHYGRMRITAPGTSWFCTNWFAISGSKLAVNGYLRDANVTSLSLEAHFGDGSTESSTASLTLPVFSGWSWHLLQGGLGGAAFDVPQGATHVILCVVASTDGSCSPSNPAYVDLDAMSAHGYDPQ